MGKKKRGINLSVLFMEIYQSLGNANVINIYLQHGSEWPSRPHVYKLYKYIYIYTKSEREREGDREVDTESAYAQWGFFFFTNSMSH